MRPRSKLVAAIAPAFVLVAVVSGCTPAAPDLRATTGAAGAARAPADLAGVPAAGLEVVVAVSRPVDAPREPPPLVRGLPAPDGVRVARVEEVQRGPQSVTRRVRITNADDGGAVSVAEAVNLQDLAWSPDGTKLAFCEGMVLHVADADGRTSRRLYVGPGGPHSGACFDLAWAGDGRRLSFVQVEDADRPESSDPIAVVLSLEAIGTER